MHGVRSGEPARRAAGGREGASPQLAAGDELRNGFVAEARIAARVRHPNIVDVLDIGVDRQGTPFIVMELLDGETLEEILEARGPLPIPYACELMTQVLAAVAAAHEAGIIHRDLKPANVMVTHPRPDRPQVKVLDFGIAEGRVEHDHDALGCAGTPLYMPPEQALGKELDVRSDVYSACAMFYELLVGRSPFARLLSSPEVLAASLTGKFEPLSVHLPGVPRELANAIESGLSVDRRRRPPSAAALAELIAPFAELTGISRVRPCSGISLAPIALVGHKQAAVETPPASVDVALLPLHATEPAEGEAPRAPSEPWRPAVRAQWVAPALLMVLGFAAGLALCWGLLPP